MPHTLFRRPGLLLLAVLALIATSFRLTDLAQAPVAEAGANAHLLPPAAPIGQDPQPTATPAPTAQPTPTARPADTPWRVGLQVGHWKSNELPEELKRLRGSTGAHAAGISETQVNLDIAQRVAKLLEQAGVVVDVLPATVPPGYDADAFIAIHADGSNSTKSRGYKLATPWRTSRAAQHLLDVMTAEYGAATKLPRDGAITFNMRGYYAFSWRRHEHAIAKTTPAVILEMGFLTNASDRAFLTTRQDVVAAGIANGILRYLKEHDRNDGGSLLPPDFKPHRSASPNGVAVRAAPSDNARVVIQALPDQRMSVFQEHDGWFQVFVRGKSRLTGWVRKDQVVETDEPQPTPLPATDS